MSTRPAITKKEYQYGFHEKENYVFKSGRGLSENTVHEISKMKSEPAWMLEFRLRALKIFQQKPLPRWGGDLTQIDFDNIHYFIRPSEKQGKTWDDVPAEVKNTFDRLGIPEAEKKFLAGVGAQYESEVVYHSLKASLQKLGVVFLDMDSALREHPDIVKEYFGTIIPPDDNKFAALNSAVWSGGSFVFVPAGVSVDLPLQAYFRINAENMGQFERTLIIAEEGANVHYVEGCTAPIYATDSLHSAVVEIIVRKKAKVRYTTIQNWSKNVYNLVTKRAYAYEEASMEWVDGNMGCVTTDTDIFLSNKVKKISDVAPGDTVCSLDSTMQLVQNCILAKRYSGKKQVFRLQTENYREIKATANHPFLTLAKVGKQLTLTWKRLDEIRLGDHVALSGAIPDNGQEKVFIAQALKGGKKIRLPKKSTAKLLWMLGFYLGDGYLDGSRICFAVPPCDPAHPCLLKTLADIFDIRDTKQYGVVVRVNSVDLKNWILRNGFGGSARTKRVPSWVYCLPKEQRVAFIEGYIAADGHIRKGHKNISITSVNRKLLEDIKTLAISCGLDPRKISKWTRREKKPLGKKEKVYKHFFLYFGEKDYAAPLHFRSVTAIEPLGKQPTWDLEIENSHNFVANGFIVHNSKLTMKYPSIYLMGKKARGEILSLAFAGDGQHQDAGGKVIHMAPDTTSIITSKSVSQGEGRTSYRGLVRVQPGATGAKVKVRCDALLLDAPSRSDTYPTMDIQEQDATVEHEAVVSKIGDDQLFYLQSRGLSEADASAMIVNGFIEPIVKELPMEYAVELNRLVQLEMEGSVG